MLQRILTTRRAQAKAACVPAERVVVIESGILAPDPGAALRQLFS